MWSADKPHVVVFAGSESDLKQIANSKLQEVFRSVGIFFRVIVASAHRNPRELRQFVEEFVSQGTRCFVAVAGKAAALPGDISAIVEGRCPVVGVPLNSPPFGPMDALLSMVSMPPGRHVMVVGDLTNAALAVASMFALADDQIYHSLSEYQLRTNKPPIADVDLAKYRDKKE